MTSASIFPFSTHMGVLLKAFESTAGDVLELGMGAGSTPILHWLCARAARRLVSYDNDEKWVRGLQNFAAPWHEVHLASDWAQIEIQRPWGLALVDHAPALRRRIEIMRLAAYADLIVVHDTEPSCETFYKYGDVWPMFRYRWTYRDCRPQTTVCSMRVDVRDWTL